MHPFIYQSKNDKSNLGNTYLETEKQFDDWYLSVANQPEYVFRGQKEARYQNYTSAQRFYLERGFRGESPANIVKEQLNVLRTKFGDILEKYCKSINTLCSDLFLLSLAQHCGGKTPLIDFTHDINIALYFMTEKNYDNQRIMRYENDLAEYSSIYYITTPDVLRFDDMVNTSAKVLRVNGDVPKEQLQWEFESICSRLFSYRALNDLWSAKNILIENKVYEYQIGKHTLSTSISINNLNIIAQSGCFVYHDNTRLALHTKLSCANVNKSLHKYIREKYLKNYTRERVFPFEENSFIKKALEETCTNLKLG